MHSYVFLKSWLIPTVVLAVHVLDDVHICYTIALFIEKPRLNHLNRIFIEKYATKWKDIAAQLGISTEDIEIIEVDSPSTQECCRVMLLVWLQRDLKASWKRLHDVLKGYCSTGVKIKIYYQY